ncbi:hypothetical protein D6853_07135 [Butyrivibrio sp. X503]|uniref:hypothetical protein n=1 Tax=Butyrivibrio sp. X503 TaxID=2364878 RepID=UPI000EA92C36|nr:hypothetical protein [Butyrivibrio sp. X503]RKM56552.1 hypothetical protein D6853_07135 [Butyrivibrio sp. X503]
MTIKKDGTYTFTLIITIIMPVIAIIVLGINFYIFKPKNNHVDTSEIKNYVINNVDYLTEITKQLLEAEDNDEYPSTYENESEIPEGIDADKLFKDLWVHYIYVCTDAKDMEDIVEIKLRNKAGKYNCSIYYSPSGKLLDHGRPKEGNTFEVEEPRYKFRTEKICDNWYYSEEYRW